MHKLYTRNHTHLKLRLVPIFLSFKMVISSPWFRPRTYTTTCSFLSRASTYYTPKFSKISPMRAAIINKSKRFEWLDKRRRYSLPITETVCEHEQLKSDNEYSYVNQKNNYKTPSILPNMDIYYNEIDDYFAVVHSQKKRLQLDDRKSVTGFIPTNEEVNLEDKYIIEDKIKAQINYLQKNDPNFIWDSQSISKTFQIPLEAVMKQTPPTQNQVEAMDCYKIFKSKLTTIDKFQYKVYLEKVRYEYLEKMKVEFSDYYA